MEGSPTTKKEYVISTLATLPIADIKVRDDFNPRENAVKASIEQLAKSIGHRGLLQPLVVTPNDTGYYLVDGHRRLLACRELGFTEVPVAIRAESDEAEQLIDAVTANVQREDLTIVEEAKAFARLKEQGKGVKQIASELGVSQKLVSSRLALLTLPGPALKLVESGALAPGHIPTLVEMAKVSPNLATGMATVIVEREIPAAQFASEPFQRVPQGHDKDLDIWIVGTPSTVQLNSVAKDLGELDRARLKEIGELRGTDTPHAVSIDVEPGVAYGCVYAPPESDDAWGVKYAVCDRAWMVQAVKDSIQKVVEQDRVRYADSGAATSESGEGSAESTPAQTEEQAKEQARAERKAEAEARLVSHAVNLNLGAELFTNLAQVELTYDVAVLLAELVIANEATTLFMAGTRFCDPKLSEEVAPKNGGVAKIAYKVPEKAPQQADYVMDFIKRADNGEQVLGRLLQVLGMAGLSDQTAVAQSNRVHPPACAKSAAEPIADLLGAKLPVPIRERLDADKRKAAEVDAQRAEWVAKRDAEAKAQADAEDASAAAVMATEDTTEKARLAREHIEEYGDPDGRFEELLEGTEYAYED